MYFTIIIKIGTVICLLGISHPNANNEQPETVSCSSSDGQQAHAGSSEQALAPPGWDRAGVREVGLVLHTLPVTSATQHSSSTAPARSEPAADSELGAGAGVGIQPPAQLTNTLN